MQYLLQELFVTKFPIDWWTCTWLHKKPPKNGLFSENVLPSRIGLSHFLSHCGKRNFDKIIIFSLNQELFFVFIDSRTKVRIRLNIYPYKKNFNNFTIREFHISSFPRWDRANNRTNIIKVEVWKPYICLPRESIYLPVTYVWSRKNDWWPRSGRLTDTFPFFFSHTFYLLCTHSTWRCVAESTNAKAGLCS